MYCLWDTKGLIERNLILCYVLSGRRKECVMNVYLFSYFFKLVFKMFGTIYLQKPSAESVS